MNYHFLSVAAIAALALAPVGMADGTEQLGNPSIPIAPATHSVAAGIGLNDGQPGVIQVDVPIGAAVKQVLLYWEGLDWNASDHGDTAPITVAGVPMVGDRIGGPSDLFGSSFSSTFRADITALNLVGPGPNAVQIAGVDFTRFQDGAGLVVLFDLPNSSTLVQIADGNDIVNDLLPAPYDNTAPVSFSFSPAPVDRTVPVSLFFASFFPDRASVIVFSVDGQQVDLLIDEIGHADGASWTTIQHDVFVPAGGSTLTIQALPIELPTEPQVFNGTAKFVWLFASASFDVAAGVSGGLTPGFWKNHEGCWDGVGTDLTSTVKASDGFNATFGVTATVSGLANSVTLIQAAGTGGGGKLALARHAAAALANADSAVGYPYGVQEVKQLYRDGVGADVGPETVASAKDKLEAANELGFEFEGGKPCGNSTGGGSKGGKGKK